MKVNTFSMLLASTFTLVAAPALATIDPTPPPPAPKCIQDGGTERCDNGWGNGPDGTNAGSFSGGTADSKSTNGASRNDKNYPAALDKFDGR